MTTDFRSSKRFKKIIGYAIIAIIWLFIWDIAAYFVNNAYFLPNVKKTFVALFNLFKVSSTYKVILFTLTRVLTGLAIGVAAGVLLAYIAHKAEFIKSFLSPAISVMKSTPVATFIVLLYITLRGSALPIFISFLMVMPIIWQNVTDGFSSVSKQLTEVCDIFAFSKKKRFRHLILPTVIKFFIPALVTSTGLAWKAEIASEIMAYTVNSIGQMINDANQLNSDTATVFAWTVIIVVFSVVLELGAKSYLKRFKDES